MKTSVLYSDSHLDEIKRSPEEFGRDHELVTVDVNLAELTTEQLRSFIIENWGKKIIPAKTQHLK